MGPRVATTKAEVERTKRQRRYQLATMLALAGAGLSLATLAGGLTAALNYRAHKIAGPQLEQAEKLEADNTVIKAQLAALKRQVSGLTPSASVAPSSAEVAKLNDAVSELANRQKRIEDAISRDPARALELPLLRRDVDNIKENQAQAVDAMNQRLDQIFDLNKWLLGGGALSLLSIALSILLGRSKPRGEQ